MHTRTYRFIHIGFCLFHLFYHCWVPNIYP